MANKTLLSVIQDVCTEVGVDFPVVVLTNKSPDIVKLVAYTKAACDHLADEFDQQQLLRTYSFTTVPGEDTYALPTDYLRAVKQTFWNKGQNWQMNGSISPVGWSLLQNKYGTAEPARFRIVGNKFQIFPVPTTAQEFNFQYISIAYVWDPTIQNYKQVFESDSDVPAFHGRCLTDFVILKWKEETGMDTTSALVNFNESLKAAKASEAPKNVVNMLGCRGIPMLGTANMPEWGQPL